MKIRIIYILILLSSSSVGQQWVLDTNNFFNLSGGTHLINNMEIIDDTLYIGGAFSHIGSLSAWSFAAYDGTQFHTFGSGMNTGGVFDFCMYKGNLYVCGAFWNAGGVPETANMARWDGNQWNSIIDFNNSIDFLIVYDSLLLIGGTNFTYNSHTYFGIAGYDGSNFHDIGILSDPIRAGIINGELFSAGGWFTVKRYDGGTIWTDVSGYNSYYVRDMHVDTINSFLYITGDFVIVDNDIPCDGVAYYDGFNWHGLYGGTVTEAWKSDLEIYRGEIYVGTGLDTVDGIAVNYITRWDGSQWQPLGSGLDQVASSLSVYHDTLFVGGYFTEAGGDTAVGLARWYMPPDTTCKYLKPIAETYADTFSLYNDSVEVQFYNNNPYVQTWEWNFDDGETADVRLPTHYYSVAGIYNACVTVNDTGCIKTACKTIVVEDHTGFKDVETNELCFKLYPNPTDGNFYAEVSCQRGSQGLTQSQTLTGKREVEIKITGLNGHIKTTIPVTTEKTLINTTGWAKGPYVCNLVIDGKLVRSEKMVLK